MNRSGVKNFNYNPSIRCVRPQTPLSFNTIAKFYHQNKKVGSGSVIEKCGLHQKNYSPIKGTFTLKKGIKTGFGCQDHEPD